MNAINLKFIKDMRIQNNLTLMQMSEELGFKNASTYLKYENGEYAFKAEMLPILAKVFNCDMANFFNH